MVTTIPAGTLRLLLTSISYRAKARKRDAARAANGSAPPVPGRKHNARPTRCHANARRWKHRDPAELAWSAMLHCLAWIYNRGTPLRPYIPYYNRAAVLPCIASGVALVSGIRWRCYGAVIRSSVAQVVL